MLNRGHVAYDGPGGGVGTLTTLFVDLNSYFASVEQQQNPALRGKPVAVVPMMVDTTSCIAASYEAKAFGVKTGTRVGDARRMCPGIIFVKAGVGDYVGFHHRILEAAETVLPIHAVHSIDEFSCRLLGAQKERVEAERLARAVKRAILTRVGECMTCSIGIAPNRMLAKVCSDMQKPNGLVVIEKHELPDRLLPLALTDLPGVGPRMAQRLARKGIATMADFLACDAARMEEVWESVLGRWWYDTLRGEDLPERKTLRRSIGHSHVLPPELRTLEGARGVMIRLLTKAAARARNLGYKARRLSAGVRYVGDRSAMGWGNVGRGWADDVTFPECSDTITLVELFGDLWNRHEQWRQEQLRTIAAYATTTLYDASMSRSESRSIPLTPFKASVTLDELVPDASSTSSLFGEYEERERISKAMDRVNARFGKNAVYLGSMHDTKHTAPQRIAFGVIPDLNFEAADDGEDEILSYL